MTDEEVARFWQAAEARALVTRKLVETFERQFDQLVGDRAAVLAEIDRAIDADYRRQAEAAAKPGDAGR